MSRSAFVTFAIIFFIVITLVTFIPIPPALLGYVFAFVFGRGYMRSRPRSVAELLFLGGVCGLGTLVALSFLRGTILSFLPPTILLLSVGTVISFWVGNLWEYQNKKRSDSL